MADIPVPSFIDRDPAAILAAMIADYEARSGKTLQPGQAEMLLINSWAYREWLLREAVQSSGLQSLVDFATGINLDYLGSLVGVQRLPAQSATCIMRFLFVSGHIAITMPAGIRIQSVDGLATFSLREDLFVDIGTGSEDIEVVCDTPGIIGNDFQIGAVNVILDPQAYLSAASNLGITATGSDAESDDGLRERIKLAPGSFSNAGSKEAYEFFARSAHPDIIDVKVLGHADDNTIPGGDVHIYILSNELLQGNSTTTILADVLAACNPDKVRPLTDTVVVFDAILIHSSIDYEVILFKNADEPSTVILGNTALSAYAASKATKMGQDIILTQIVAAGTLKDLVYNGTLVSPSSDIVVDDKSVVVFDGITFNVSGPPNEG